MTFQLQNDSLRIGDVTLRFQRTLRIPDDGRRYPLPPGLGAFPLRRVDDFADRVPDEWRERGGVMVPMYQREAMWLHMSAPQWKPHALKVGVGKVCAITGEPWSESLHAMPSRGVFRGDGPKQDYVVFPPQPWLDGICTGKGTIRQFVAMPLGLGYTVEGQVTGEERFGGLQLKVVPPKAGRFAPPPPPRFSAAMGAASGGGMMPCAPPAPCAAPGAGPSAMPRVRRAQAMGLAAGGQMKQKIYPDPHGLETWDLDAASRVFVHIVSSDQWRDITGEAPPPSPVSAKTYAQHGLPWFDLYDEHAPTVAPTSTLSGVKSIATIDAEKSTHALQDDDSVETPFVNKLWSALVRDGKW
ncbi:MAG: hypothetical protein R3B99_18280 [Polyangiales bacterium]|nr:hypothetical protein [Sandaracinus sp.]MCB9624739.1 hypothetical protein [Sandaracinus sp.]